MLSFGVIGVVMFDLRKHPMKPDAEKRGQLVNTCHFCSHCLHARNWNKGSSERTRARSRGLQNPHANTPTWQSESEGG